MTRSSAPLTKGRGRPRRRATSPPWPLSSTSPRSRPRPLPRFRPLQRLRSPRHRFLTRFSYKFMLRSEASICLHGCVRLVYRSRSRQICSLYSSQK